MISEKELRERMDILIDEYERTSEYQVIRRLGQLAAIQEMKFILLDEDMNEWMDKHSDLLTWIDRGPGAFKIAEGMIKLCMKEYIDETNHGTADPPSNWEEAIRDFVVALGHYEVLPPKYYFGLRA